MLLYFRAIITVTLQIKILQIKNKYIYKLNYPTLLYKARVQNQKQVQIWIWLYDIYLPDKPYYYKILHTTYPNQSKKLLSGLVI